MDVMKVRHPVDGDLRFEIEGERVTDMRLPCRHLNTPVGETCPVCGQIAAKTEEE